MIERILRAAADPLGYTLQRKSGNGTAPSPDQFPADFSPKEQETCRAVRPYTMTSPERVVSLTRAVEYLERCHVPGAFVECGVWRGGSMMAVARTLLAGDSSSRDLFLFDTYSGMPEAAQADVDLHGRTGAELLAQLRQLTPEQQAENHVLAYCPVDTVRKNVLSTGYPSEKLHFVEGRVEDTIPEHAPGQIALLRLDTDWYESTRHELVHLFPRLSRCGLLIVDDYGYWRGARRAVDEYFHETSERIFLSRIDFTCRIAVRC